MQPDLNAPVAAAQQMKQNTQGLLANQDLKTNDFLTRYGNTLGSQEKTGALATRLGSELGIPQLQTNANLLRDTVTNLPGTYSAATRGFDVNANQLQRIIGQKTSEIAPAMDTAERALSNAQNTLSTRLGYETRDQDRALLPFDKEQGFLTDRIARETSLFSQDNQRELDAISQKVQNGITLSEGEKNRAQQLLVAEKGYQAQMDQIKAQQQGGAGGNADTSIIEVGGHKKLVDNRTGQVLADFGASGTGTSSFNPYATYGAQLTQPAAGSGQTTTISAQNGQWVM